MAKNNKGKNYKPANKIAFSNERSELITKVENTTGGWRFFGYLYNTAMFRSLLLQLLMLICFVPAIAVILIFSSKLMGLSQNLPYSASFGLGIMPWFGLEPYITSSTAAISQSMYLWLLLAIPVITVGLAGGFAVIRDSYWTGKLTVFKSFGKGICQSALKFLPFAVIFALGLMGNYYLSQAIVSLAGWLQVVITIAVWAVLAVIMLFGFVYLGTSTLYKEPFAKGFVNAFRLTFRHFFSNLCTFIFVLLPFVLLVVVNSSMVQTMVGVLVIMFGMLYVAIVWMIHMIRVCAPYAR